MGGVRLVQGCAQWMLCAVFVVALSGASSAHAAGDPPPCDVGENDYGSSTNGERVWYFVPSGGGNHPVVIYLHGFSLPAPEIYQAHIDHLVAQGYFVVFPQYNIVPTFFDLNQYAMLDRAIDAVDLAVYACEGVLDTQDVSIFGHSLGGNMAAAWTARGGMTADRILLANPSTDAGFVGFITNELDHVGMAPATSAQVMILTGDEDTIAAPSQSTQLHDLMVNAASRVVYQASSTSNLVADHMAPIQDDGWAPGWMMDLFGGRGTNDALDSEYYWSAFDALLAGAATHGFPAQNGWTVSTLRACAGSACAY